MSTNLILTSIAESMGADVLPDSDIWEYRLQIRSETSSRLYVVSRNKRTHEWGCSCPGWKSHRRCKHLQSMGGQLRRLT